MRVKWGEGFLLLAHQSDGDIQCGCYFHKRTKKYKNGVEGRSESARHHPYPSPSPLSHVCTLKQNWGCKSTFSKTYHCGGRRGLVRDRGPGPQPRPSRSWGGRSHPLRLPSCGVWEVFAEGVPALPVAEGGFQLHGAAECRGHDHLTVLAVVSEGH